MDLRTSYPRSIRVKLAGHAHLTRMIDKCRASLAGTLGEYLYPCPLDKRLLEFAGLTAEEFLDAVRGRTDDEIVRWLQAKARPHSQAEIEAWNEQLFSLGPDTDEKWAYFNKLRDAADPSRTDITSWADLLDLDEKRPVPKRTANVGG